MGENKEQGEETAEPFPSFSCHHYWLTGKMNLNDKLSEIIVFIEKCLVPFTCLCNCHISGVSAKQSHVSCRSSGLHKCGW